MGGVFVIIYDENNTSNAGMESIRSFLNTKNRGPDDTHYGIYSTDNIHNFNQIQKMEMQKRLTRTQLQAYKQYTAVLGYHRLAINGNDADSNQPFENITSSGVGPRKEYKKRMLICNGEVYNYKNFGVPLYSESDVEVILTDYVSNNSTSATAEDAMIKTLNKINGDFSMCLIENIETYELDKVNIFLARDPYGIKPLYYVTNNKGFYMFVSELKNIPNYILQDKSFIIKQFPPGHFWSFQKNCINNLTKNIVFTPYYTGLDTWKNVENCNKLTDNDELEKIYSKMEELVTDSIKLRCVVSDTQKIGVFLSGGIGSIIISSIIIKLFKDQIENIHFFSYDNQKELDNIKEYIRSREDMYRIKLSHHIIHVEPDCFDTDKYNNVIKCMETSDKIKVHNGVIHNYLFEYIKMYKFGIKIVLTGDGLNEICGGFLNFKTITCDKEFQNCCIKSLFQINNDNISASFGIETRFPYLDKRFVEFIFSLHPKLRKANYVKKGHLVGKYIFRKAFQNSDLKIPKKLLWNEHVQLDSNISNHCCDAYFNILYKQRTNL